MIFKVKPQSGKPHDDLTAAVTGHQEIIAAIAAHAEKREREREQLAARQDSADVQRG